MQSLTIKYGILSVPDVNVFVNPLAFIMSSRLVSQIHIVFLCCVVSEEVNILLIEYTELKYFVKTISWGDSNLSFVLLSIIRPVKEEHLFCYWLTTKILYDYEKIICMQCQFYFLLLYEWIHILDDGIERQFLIFFCVAFLTYKYIYLASRWKWILFSVII